MQQPLETNISYLDEKKATVVQSRIKGFIARQKYSIFHLPDNKLTKYPTFAIGNDPKIQSLKEYKKPGKIAVLSTAGLTAVKVALKLTNKIDMSAIPLVIISTSSVPPLNSAKSERHSVVI